MLMRKMIIGGLCVFMAVSSAHADEYITLSDFELWSTLSGTDIIRVIPKGIPVSNLSCSGVGSDPDSYLVKSTLPAASISRIYATLLAAKMSSKSVKIYTSGCETNRPAITNAIIP